MATRNSKTATSKAAAAAVKVFLSHSSKDVDAVTALAAELTALGSTVWRFEEELPIGDPIRDVVEKHIRESDFFLLCHSESAAISSWVRQELDLALSLEGPESCAVRVIKLDGTALAPIPRDSWKTGEPTSADYDCGAVRCFDPAARTDSKKHFIAGFAPRIDYYGYLGQSGDDLPEAFFDAYDQLFPDEDERAPHEDTRGWLNESHSEPGLAYRDLIVTLTVAEKPVSFIYVTPYMTTGLVFGSYFGVLRKHRIKNYAKIIYDDASLQLNRMYEAACREERARSWRRSLLSAFGGGRGSGNWAPKPHGHLFEVRPIPADDVRRIIGAIEAVGLPTDADQVTAPQRLALEETLDEDDLELMRAAKRIAIYETNKCRAILRADRSPMPYIQPILEAPVDPAKELPMVVMYCPINTSCEAFARDFRYEAIVNGFYLDWYKDANGKANEREIPGYVEYLRDLTRRVLEQSDECFILGSLLTPQVKQLLALDRRYKISGAL